jgi:large subunit ribosomal protein L3
MSTTNEHSQAVSGTTQPANIQCGSFDLLPLEPTQRETTMTRTAIVGEKVGMTQLWENDAIVPVTVVKVSPARVVQVKTVENDGYAAIQVTFGSVKASRLNGPQKGHFDKAGVEPGRELLEFRVDDSSAWTVGQAIGVDLLTDGQLVDVTAVSKGKGFAGVMKRHNFSGLPASHGAHRNHRSPGSIGACATPGRVFRGQKMAGRMGTDQVTTQNLRVIKADAEREILLVRGSVPGPKGGTVVIRIASKG